MNILEQSSKTMEKSEFQASGVRFLPECDENVTILWLSFICTGIFVIIGKIFISLWMISSF